MDLAQLRYFLRVAECNSFTQAAAKCAVSQPALSQQIAKLEKEFGQPLFARSGRNVTLTPAGQSLKEHSERILQLVDDAKKAITDNGSGGRLHLAVVPDVSNFLTRVLLPSLTAEFPSTEILVTEQPLELLMKRCERGEFDLLFISLPSKRSIELQTEELVTDAVHFVVPADHPLASKRELQLADIAGQRLVLLNEYHSLTKWLVEVFNERQLKIKISARVDQVSTLLRLVELRNGISLLPASLLPDKPIAGIKHRELTDAPLCRKIAMCWHANRYQTQLVTNLLKAVRLHADPINSGADNRSATPKKVSVK